MKTAFKRLPKDEESIFIKTKDKLSSPRLHGMEQWVREKMIHKKQSHSSGADSDLDFGSITWLRTKTIMLADAVNSWGHYLWNMKGLRMWDYGPDWRMSCGKQVRVHTDKWANECLKHNTDVEGSTWPQGPYVHLWQFMYIAESPLNVYTFFGRDSRGL